MQAALAVSGCPVVFAALVGATCPIGEVPVSLVAVLPRFAANTVDGGSYYFRFQSAGLGDDADGVVVDVAAAAAASAAAVAGEFAGLVVGVEHGGAVEPESGRMEKAAVGDFPA